MSKLLTISLFVMVSFFSKACPACNIHNYLYSSVLNSKNIYKGVVLKAPKKNSAKILVLEILKSDKNSTIKVGEIIESYLYSAKENVGQEFILSDPLSRGPNYPTLESRYEWEVKYLLDSTRVVTTVDEAIKLLECISAKSNRDGRDFIEANYSESYESLTKRIIEFRTECQLNEDDFFNSWRITNLISALALQSNEQTEKFLLNELDSISQFDPGEISVDDLNYNGKSPIAEYVRYILQSNKDAEMYERLITHCVESITNSTSSNSIYFTYALSFTDQPLMDNIEISDENRDFVTLGLVSAALWNRYYFRKDEVRTLLKMIKSLNVNAEIDSFILKRFEDYMK